jgi:hypothetical protein
MYPRANPRKLKGDKMKTLSDIEYDHDRKDAERIIREYMPKDLDGYDKRVWISELVDVYREPLPVSDNYVY